MVVSARLKADTDHVVQLLQRLQYSGVECREEAWLQRLLYEQGEPREQLLQWLLLQLAPPEEAARCEEARLARHPSATHKVTQCLSSLGLCRASDTALVDGSATAVQQARFWRLLLESLSSKRCLQRLSTEGLVQRRSDQLLHTLCRSRAVHQVTKSEGSSLLPGDLQERYRAWSRQGRQQAAVSDLLAETRQQLDDVRRQYQQVPEECRSVPSGAALSQARHSAVTAMSSLHESALLFTQVHNTHLSSWLPAGGREAEQQQQARQLPDTGLVIQEARNELLKLTQALSSIRELADKTEELEEAEMAVQRTLEQPSTVTSIVHRLTASKTTS